MTQEEFFKRYNFNIHTDCLGGGGFSTVYKVYQKVQELMPLITKDVKKVIVGKYMGIHYSGYSYYDNCINFGN